jgi:hypothetical protein
MSLRQVPAATLGGYNGPRYPDEAIRELVAALTRPGPAGFSSKTLLEAAAKCEGYVAAPGTLRTADGHIWRCILMFQVGSGRVALAVPGTQDWDRRDGTQLDRSPACYVKDGATDRDILTVIQALARALPG